MGLWILLDLVVDTAEGERVLGKQLHEWGEEVQSYNMVDDIQSEGMMWRLNASGIG